VRAIVQIGITVALTAALGPLGLSTAIAGAAAAFGGAAIVTGLSGGNLGQVLRAGLIAGATAFAFLEVGSATNAIAGVDPAAAHIQPGFDTPGAFAFNVAGHALVGCASSAASGGSCESGALSGAVTAGAGPLINGQSFGVALAENAVLGGVASVAGGGKFANGAITGAFGYMFNNQAGKIAGGIIGGILAEAAGPEAVPEGIILGAKLGDFLTGPNAPYTRSGIQNIEAYLSSLDSLEYNHESIESGLVAGGMDVAAAHLETLRLQGIPYAPGFQAQIYHPSVIQQFPDSFNEATRKAAGVP